MPAEPIPSSSFSPPSDHNRPYVIQDDQIAPVSQAEVNVSQTVKQGPERVIHDVIQNREVIQNEPNVQQKPCDTDRDTQCDTTCITKADELRHALSQVDQPPGPNQFAPSKIARLAGELSGQVRRDRAATLKKLTTYTINSLPKLDRLVESLQKAPLLRVNLGKEIEIVRIQIQSIDKLMKNKDLEPREWLQLAAAKEKLFAIFAHASGIPKPGSVKPSKERGINRAMPIEPVEPGNPE